ncbi:MAG: hypothetical protein IPI91_19970 [Flavobacteriales bacterium]|nr:hypothetical protein [Flavobacteriales bacterium]
MRMSPLPTLILLTLLPFTFDLCAQTEVRITNVAALSEPVNIGADPIARAGIQAQGVEQERLEEVINFSRPAYWPIGLRSDSARNVNAETAKNYVAFLVCSYHTAEIPMVIIRIPAASNIHMPEDMRMGQDFYLVLTEDDIIAAPTRVSASKPSKGPAYGRMPKARIKKPEGVYATYDLGKDPAALEVLERRGLSKQEIEAVVFRSQQRNWPDGIDSFEERFPKLAKFKKFKAFSAAKWDGKVLLIIPAEKNKKVHPTLRPYLDIYMVYEENSVAVAGKGR